ncbi:hypothetical protein LCGC14_1487850 [marine sediment metagenome]|uniref:Uncharacterized protein n=1 Tax=marine sediment metagenome TaxID=412755 RepID=A0A0F9M9I4_9ZZZZ
MKVEFNDLSGWLKTAIVLAWVTGVTYALFFFVGFIAEVASW